MFEEAGESKDGAVVRALASHQCGPGFEYWRRRHMWVECVVGSLLCSKRFFSGCSGFPISLKTNISKFQFDLERTDNAPKCSVGKQITIFNFFFEISFNFVIVQYEFEISYRAVTLPLLN